MSEVTIKKHIDGKIYDTSKAEFIGTHKDGTTNKSLYKTKNKRFFLAIYSDDRRYYDIVPTSVSSAEDWVANYAPDKLAEVFPHYKAVEA